MKCQLCESEVRLTEEIEGLEICRLKVWKSAGLVRAF